MKTLPGQCANEMFCTHGASARLIAVPEGQPFICPLCGKRLITVAAPRRNWKRRAAVFGILVTLLIFAAFLLGGMAAYVIFSR